MDSDIKDRRRKKQKKKTNQDQILRCMAGYSNSFLKSLRISLFSLVLNNNSHRITTAVTLAGLFSFVINYPFPHVPLPSTFVLHETLSYSGGRSEHRKSTMAITYYYYGLVCGLDRMEPFQSNVSDMPDIVVL